MLFVIGRSAFPLTFSLEKPRRSIAESFTHSGGSDVLSSVSLFQR